jgi:hypothetical protein
VRLRTAPARLPPLPFRESELIATRLPECSMIPFFRRRSEASTDNASTERPKQTHDLYALSAFEMIANGRTADRSDCSISLFNRAEQLESSQRRS